MGIKDDLAARNSSFVSLRDLLNALSEHQKVTLQDAADWLSGKLHRAGDSGPKWCELLPGMGIGYVTKNRKTDASNALWHVVHNGTFTDYSGDVDDAIPF